MPKSASDFADARRSVIRRVPWAAASARCVRSDSWWRPSRSQRRRSAVLRRVVPGSCRPCRSRGWRRRTTMTRRAGRSAGGRTAVPRPCWRRRRRRQSACWTGRRRTPRRPGRRRRRGLPVRPPRRRCRRRRRIRRCWTRQLWTDCRVDDVVMTSARLVLHCRRADVTATPVLLPSFRP